MSACASWIVTGSVWDAAFDELDWFCEQTLISASKRAENLFDHIWCAVVLLTEIKWSLELIRKKCKKKSIRTVAIKQGHPWHDT